MSPPTPPKEITDKIVDMYVEEAAHTLFASIEEQMHGLCAPPFDTVHRECIQTINKISIIARVSPSCLHRVTSTILPAMIAAATRLRDWSKKCTRIFEVYVRETDAGVLGGPELRARLALWSSKLRDAEDLRRIMGRTLKAWQRVQDGTWKEFGVSRRAPTLFILLLFRSRLGGIDRFHHSLAAAECIDCCSEYPVLTNRV